jgi:hypothetical protein
MTEKLEIGTVFQRVFDTYRSQLGLLLPAALIIFVPVAVLNGIVLESGSPVAAVATIAIAGVGTYWFQGMVVEATRDILDGRRDHTLGSLFKSVAPVLVPLIIAGLLAGLGAAVGLLLLIAPGLFLLTIWAVIAPVIVIERTGAVEAFGRSRQLVRGHGWQVFGVIVTIFLVQLVLGLVLGAILGSVSDTFATRSIGDLVLRVLIAPISALAAAVVYFELKRLKGEQLPAGGSYQPQATSASGTSTFGPEAPASSPPPSAPEAPSRGAATPPPETSGPQAPPPQR